MKLTKKLKNTYVIKYKDYYSIRYKTEGINQDIFGNFAQRYYFDICEADILKKYNVPVDDDYIIFDTTKSILFVHFIKRYVTAR